MSSMNSFQLLGLTFHWYGLVMGAAILLTTELMVRQGRRQGVAESQLWSHWWWMLGGALVGARVWHVATDYHLYLSQPWQVIAVWRGGLSILGAVAGAGIAGWWRQRTLPPTQRLSLSLMADLVAFGLPAGQALGRLGNWLNQELFGWPSQLPWAIIIDPAHRPAGWEQYATFHPLFAYEMIVTGGFAVVAWWWSLQKQPKLGSGSVFWWYMIYYSVARFALDFLRVEKAMWGPLGQNQWVLLFVVVVAGCWRWRRYFRPATIMILVIGLSVLSGCRPNLPWSSSSIAELHQLSDRARVSLQANQTTLSVEVVNTPASISQGLSGREELGADGMLFVFESERRPGFWMRQMQFDLDLVWIRNMTVVAGGGGGGGQPPPPPTPNSR